MTKIVVDTFGSQISRKLQDKAVCNQLIKIVSSYVDRNTEKLSTTGPVKQTTFSAGDKNNIYDLFGLNEKTIELTSKKSTDLSRGVNTANPFNIAMTLIIRECHIRKLANERKSCAVYLILSMYPSIFKKYFKFEPNDRIMAYTINNLSNKYKVKQMGTILAALVDTVTILDNHYSSNLMRGTDKDIADYIAAVKTRLNALIKNICSEFMKQHDSGKYMNYEIDNEDEENFSTADSNSYLVERLSNAVVLDLSVRGPDMKVVTIAAKLNKVSTNDLRTTVTKMCKDNKNRAQIKEVISCILYDFLFDGENSQEDIYSSKFIVFSLNTYKKSNTNDSNIVKIKDILDEWLKEYSVAYKKSNMIGTLNLFRKALYMFFVFTIQKTK